MMLMTRHRPPSDQPHHSFHSRNHHSHRSSLHLLPQDVQLLSANSEMENVETSTPNSAIPDLEDKYKPTDNYESSAPTSPDRGTQG